MKNSVVVKLKFWIYSVILFAGLVYSQEFPDTIWVPVTFYDFHSDRSNPEFEQRHSGHSGQVRTGMIQSVLGPDGKPQSGPNPYMNYYIKYWFRPWEDGAQGDYTIPEYDPVAPPPPFRYEGDDWVMEFQQEVTYLGIKTVDHDTAFKNIVIRDSLPFTYDFSEGVYVYRNDNFFPLDGRGFGNEWNHELENHDHNRDQGISADHNYSFTMELHWSFVKEPGMHFMFKGDDDVWVFIDGKLQIDLGGIHENTEASFHVDEIGDLENGKVYDLDIFYAERHSSQSHIWIATNIIFAPSNLKLYKQNGPPDVGSNQPLGNSDTVTVGDSYTLYGHVFDSTGEWQPDYDSLIRWEVSASNNTGLTSTKGASTTFISSEADSKVTITARFTDPESGKESVKSVTLHINPKKTELYEIKLYDSPGNPQSLTPISSNQIIKVGGSFTLYGHVFDNIGEWQSQYDSLITWGVSTSNNIGLTSLKGASTTFISSEANSEVTITARFKDPVSGKESINSVTLFIDQLEKPSFVLKLYDSPGNPKDLSPISSQQTVTAGQTCTVYGHIFDTADVWYEEYDQYIKWSIKEFDAGILPEPSKGVQTSITPTVAGIIHIVAEFVDVSNPVQPVSRAEAEILVKADAAYKIDIQQSLDDTINYGYDNFGLLVFENNKVQDSLYAFVRDKYGNFVRYADRASWKSEDISVASLAQSYGVLGIIVKQRDGVGKETIIIVSEDGLIPDTITVTSSGEQSAVAYIIEPGKPVPPNVRSYYHKLFLDAGNISRGTLIAIESPRPLIPDSNQNSSVNSYGKVVVYDAVGNVVRSDLKLVAAGSSRTYGVLWDYTNRNKRQVGEGAYLFVVNARFVDNYNRIQPFIEQVKVAAIRR